MWRLLIWSNALYRSNNIDWSLPALLFLTYHQYMYQNGMNYQILIKIRQHSWMNTSSINHISMYSHYLLFQSLFCWQHSCKGAMVLILDGNSERDALAWRKMGLCEEKNPICECSRSNQITGIATYVRTYIWVTT